MSARGHSAHPVPAAAAALALLCLLLTGAAHPCSDAVPAAGPDDGMAVLRRSAEASGGTAYSAVRELTGEAGEGTDPTRVVNRPGDGVALVPMTAGAHPFVVTDSPFKELDERLLTTLERVYAVGDAGLDEVDGRPARTVEAVRANGTVAGRFWVDADTGVLVGSSVYGPDGRHVLGFRLTGLEPGDGYWPEEVAGDSPWGDVLTPAERGELRARGWVLPEHLAWNLGLVDARATLHAGRKVVHAVYSDGLSQVSVFSQRGKLDEDTRTAVPDGSVGTGTGGTGVTPQHDTIFGGDGGRYHGMWQADGFVYTVLADAPSDLTASAVTALPGPEDSGFWSRVQRGMSRLGLL
ncbi:transcriptional regulator [Nocardiopsis flavescens]|uniref:Sigma-E factor negative regulatory protein RseB n=1 Tax=Nocardiopsis flavescens TaxID=758803 RepID=A0A1M6FU01_9ACTN|nr:transcriptional regulator [Nocardiopsis flavescens]SHJ01174.1 sigma-E factor negative regulatory protein RseB [Nocardiopsis flavescens]